MEDLGTQGWISTKDRKPAEKQRVRFVQAGGVNQYHTGSYEGGWFHADDGSRYSEQVSRWRPVDAQD